MKTLLVLCLNPWVLCLKTDILCDILMHTMQQFNPYYVIYRHTMLLLAYYATSYSSNLPLTLSARLEAVHTRQEEGWKSTRHRANTPTYRLSARKPGGGRNVSCGPAQSGAERDGGARWAGEGTHGPSGKATPGVRATCVSKIHGYSR